MFKCINLKYFFLSFVSGIAVHLIQIKYTQFNHDTPIGSALISGTRNSESKNLSHRLQYNKWLKLKKIELNKPNDGFEYKVLLLIINTCYENKTKHF